MARRTGIILAYDKSQFLLADQNLLHAIAPYIDLVKVGLESIYAFDPESNKAIVGDQNAHYSVGGLVAGCTNDDLGKGIMWDAKLHDIGATAAKAAKNIIDPPNKIQMLTFHASMSDNSLRECAKICNAANVLPLAVTVLTDIDEHQAYERFRRPTGQTVLDLACNAFECGFGGVVSSPLELSMLHDGNSKTEQMVKVIPGIRPEWAAANDQKRVMTPGEAAKAGANYVVIGRPILQPPPGWSSVEAAKAIREELDNAVANLATV